MKKRNIGKKKAEREPKKRIKHKKSIITTIVCLIVATGFAVFGFGFPENFAEFTDAVGWLFESKENDQVIDYSHLTGDLAVHFVDVGQGDAILIQFPDEKNMLVDAGDTKNATYHTLKSHIDFYEIKTIDYLMITHTDADHIGGMDNVLIDYEVKNIYRPKITYEQHPTLAYKRFDDAAANEGANIFVSQQGMEITGEGYKLTIYLPTLEFYDSLKSTKLSSHDRNAVSPILILEYAGKKIMLTGDANLETEEEFMKLFEAGGEYYGMENIFDVDVLKVAHHGSYEASTVKFLDIVKPEYSVISVGEGNSYGHPTQSALDRLMGKDSAETDKFSDFEGSEIYRTDERGDITLIISANNGTPTIEFEFERTVNTANNEVGYKLVKVTVIFEGRRYDLKNVEVL